MKRQLNASENGEGQRAERKGANVLSLVPLSHNPIASVRAAAGDCICIVVRRSERPYGGKGPLIGTMTRREAHALKDALQSWFESEV